MRRGLVVAGLVLGLALPASATADPSLKLRGTWSGGRTYDPGSVVQFGGRTWITPSDGVPVGVAPGTNDSWVPLTEPSTIDGSRGPVGATGPAGVVGPTGLPGLHGLAGNAGPFGVLGPIGAVGLQGPSGSTGAVGLPGAAGTGGPVDPSGVVAAAGSSTPDSGRTLRFDRRGRATVPVRGLGPRSIVVLQATATGAPVRVTPVVTAVRTGRFTVRGTPRGSFRYAVVR